ncbi:hypothetical protein BJV74DRAFT_505778 [Russula compacta]|nr:hypothetical protein BJV74DRAFT_505778 [Russula compacta]
MPARSSGLRILNHVHQLPKDKSRRRSVHNPRRSVSLWSRRITKDDPAHQRRSTAVRGWEHGILGDTHLPLTEAQRIQSLRRGRKLAQLFGAEPPIALHRAASPFDELVSPNSIKGEKLKTYLALSLSDLLSIHSDRSSMQHSHSNLSSISISFPSSNSSAHETNSSQEPEG